MTKRLTAYNEALQEFNKGSKNFSFVRKDSEDYAKVKEIEARIKAERAEANAKEVVKEMEASAPKPKPKGKGKKTNPAENIITDE